MYAPNLAGGVNNMQDLPLLSLQEQLKVSGALLFQAVCEYPRSIRAFYANGDATNFFRDAEYLTNDYANYNLQMQNKLFARGRAKPNNISFCSRCKAMNCQSDVYSIRKFA